MSKVFFQIGTNNGNDQFNKLVRAHKPDIVILVEPNANLLSEIQSNYKGVSNLFIYSNAIYYRDDELIELCIPSKRGYGDVHFSLVPMNDWGEDFVKIQTKSITFDTICKEHNITEIDYLQIDTEGFDSEIIKMIDLSSYRIRVIRFEKWGFDPSCFTRHNQEIASELGHNGMALSIQKLKNHKYSIRDINDCDGVDFIAILED
jgi:FkbM family methyltransferase